MDSKYYCMQIRCPPIYMSKDMTEVWRKGQEIIGSSIETQKLIWLLTKEQVPRVHPPSRAR